MFTFFCASISRNRDSLPRSADKVGTDETIRSSKKGVISMAWYYGTYCCGHEGRTNIVGPTKNREWIKERHFEKLCSECYEKKILEDREKANAEASKYAAMASIAQTGDTTTNVAAMMSMQSSSQSQTTMQLAAPKSASDSIKEWLGLLLPVAVQGYGIKANQEIAVTQSNNSRDVAVSTNSTFTTMSGNIQGTTTTIGGNGVIGSGDFSSPATTTSTTTSSSYNPTINPVQTK